MMTSTYPGSRSNNNLNNGLKEIQSKKEALMSLETALKKRVNEFKELCLKEGELTGHLPIDYPLQPREPIPQIRRRVKNSGSCSSNSSSNNNLNDINSIAPPSSSSSSSTSFRQHQLNKLDSVQPQATFAIPSNPINFPSRPTSTNSTSSSISTASSNTRNAHNAILNPQQQVSSSSTRNSSTTTSTKLINNNNGHCFTSSHTIYNHDQQVLNPLVDHRNHHPTRYDQSNMMQNHFKRPFNMAPVPAFDSDALGHMRASSTASSSSSSGSGTSSVLSAPPAISNQHVFNGLNMNNMHVRSCSESITNDSITSSMNSHMRPKSQDMLQRQHMFNNQMSLNINSNVPPARPPRGPHHQNNRQDCPIDAVDGKLITHPSENRTSTANTHQHQKDASSGKPLQHFNMNGLTNGFQPFLEEETKPFQMSDFYKYSSKYRQKVSDPQKTTRQLQEDVLNKKNSLKYSSCDDQIQGLPKLFEKSGQKLIEATAKAIAGNPGLAEKLNHILPNNKSDRY